MGEELPDAPLLHRLGLRVPQGGVDGGTGGEEMPQALRAVAGVQRAVVGAEGGVQLVHPPWGGGRGGGAVGHRAGQELLVPLLADVPAAALPAGEKGLGALAAGGCGRGAGTVVRPAGLRAVHTGQDGVLPPVLRLRHPAETED